MVARGDGVERWRKESEGEVAIVGKEMREVSKWMVGMVLEIEGVAIY